ncbi:MAG: Trk system potassium transporter TrkA [Myxococcota bacterium]|nr:Trk system potassium transporter TrkA [Myxococcota bacterium]
MRVLIAGAGVVGTALAEQLSMEGHDVFVVDKRREILEDIEAKLDVLTIRGSASTPSVLVRAGVKQAELLIAVTNSDEVNLLVGLMGAELGVADIVVRVRNRELAGERSLLNLEALGIHHIVNPEPVMVDSVMRMLDIPGAEEVTTLAEGAAQVLKFTLDDDSPIVGKTLKAYRQVASLNAFLILEVTRGDRTFVPRGDDILKPGDHVYALAAAEAISFLVPIFHRSPPSTEHVIVAGASRLGISLARALATRVKRVYLIEPDKDRAEAAAEALEDVNVLHGATTDLDLLEEAALDHCDLFCAVSQDDQVNMLTSLLAKKHSDAHTAVLVHQPEFIPVLDSLGVESVISPRVVTISEILTHVRRGRIHSVIQMPHSDAELLLMELPNKAKVLGKPLHKIKFPSGVLVAAVSKDGLVMVANGGTVLEPGDQVFVYTRAETIPAVEKLFGES